MRQVEQNGDERNYNLQNYILSAISLKQDVAYSKIYTALSDLTRSELKDFIEYDRFQGIIHPDDKEDIALRALASIQSENLEIDSSLKTIASMHINELNRISYRRERELKNSNSRLLKENCQLLDQISRSRNIPEIVEIGIICALAAILSIVMSLVYNTCI